MESHISVTFSNFTYDSIEPPIQMELSYESKKIKFDYPKSEPILLNFSQKFINDKIHLILSTSIDVTSPKKAKLVLRGDISINKSIFQDQTLYEKNITMIPIEPSKDMKNIKNNKKLGMILIQIKLLDDFEQWKKDSKNFEKKKNVTKPKSNNILGNKEINKTKDNIKNSKNNDKKKIKDNNLSKTQDENKELISNYTKEEKNKKDNFENKKIEENEIDKIIEAENFDELKNILTNDFLNILPKDINALKSLNTDLYQKYEKINIKYNEVLKDLNSSNEELRNKIINLCKELKEMKASLEKKNEELTKIQIDNKKEEANSESDKEYIKINMKKYLNEKNNLFKTNEDYKDQEDEKNNIMKDNDIKMIYDSLKKLSSLGYDITEGLEISEEEKKFLDEIMSEKKETKNETNFIEENKENNDDYELSNQIVALIERDVNDLYIRKLIEQVKIDQIDAISYSFKGNTKTLEVRFKIKNGDLYCNDGKSFTVWLISNFGL